ncbi:hypothetical protein F4677DRAFT_466113 [Hypoxylon crocopeplum]|nr:hypothetical protein F4677DRAFT_466113 [Hypoxylon crocopeplum]
MEVLSEKAVLAKSDDFENDGRFNNNVDPDGAKADEPITGSSTEASEPTNTDARLTSALENMAIESTEAPVGVVGSDKRNNAQTPGQNETPTKTTTTEKRNFITLAHDDGKEFMLPWGVCKAWKGMEELIKLSYIGDNDAEREIDEGQYELYVEDKVVFRHYWEALVEQGWTVDVRRKSQAHLHEDSTSGSSEPSDPYDSPDEDQDAAEEGGSNSEGKYGVKAKYTIDYCEKERYSGDYELLYSMSYDDPVVLETARSIGQKLPVLEEKTTVVIAEQRSRRKPRLSSKHTPKLDERDRVEKKQLHIHSQFLINALRAVMKYSSEAPSGDEADYMQAGRFPHPYRDLFYHRQELLDYKRQTTGIRANHTEAYNEECDQHIDFLLQYLESEPTIQVKASEARWDKKIPTTTFAGLWLLMKPGTDVYVLEDGQLNVYVIDEVSGGLGRFFGATWSITIKSYSIRLWNLIYDGKVIKRRSKVIEVPVFDNERDITSLPLFPTRFQDRLDGGARRKQLIGRGEKFFRAAKGPAFLEYTGSGSRPGWKKYNRARVVVEHESQPWDTWSDEDREVMKDWMLDRDEYEIELKERARTPHCECTRCRGVDARRERFASATFSNYDNIDPKNTPGLSEHQYLLCMSHMFGFILKDRMYDLIDVDRLTNPRIAKDAIDQLVLRPEANKKTIKAIVQTYTDSSSQSELFSADFIHGKGEGQVFLLHGPPGTGKTLTAESVAEYTKRPLLSITAADLGHEPIELERNLLRFFKDASNWDAIVLLDEADVYLERRSTNDLQRNSIVSIFLRALDYFQGILFLTTNRVGHFDEAFLSRIHVAIGYETLDDDARGQIWSNLFRKLREDHKYGGPEIQYEYDAKEYVRKSEKIKKLEWNGREIRNAFQSAVALAIYDSRTAREKGASIEESIPEVKERHIEEIANMSTAFKSYITSTHEGIKDSDMAYKLGIRDDNFGKS